MPGGIGCHFFPTRTPIRFLASEHCITKVYCMASGGSENFEKGEGERQYLSVPSSFIANAHNELYAFYTEKGGFLKKKSEPMGGGRPPPPPPFESATVYHVSERLSGGRTRLRSGRESNPLPFDWESSAVGSMLFEPCAASLILKSVNFVDSLSFYCVSIVGLFAV